MEVSKQTHSVEGPVCRSMSRTGAHIEQDRRNIGRGQRHATRVPSVPLHRRAMAWRGSTHSVKRQGKRVRTDGARLLSGAHVEPPDGAAHLGACSRAPTRVISPSATSDAATRSATACVLSISSGTSDIATSAARTARSRRPRASRSLPANRDCGRDTAADRAAGSAPSPAQPHCSHTGQLSQCGVRPVHTDAPKSIMT